MQGKDHGGQAGSERSVYITGLLRLLGAVAAGVRAFRYLGGGNALPSACTMMALAFFLFLSMKIYAHYQEMERYFMFHNFTLDEKKRLLDYAWPFGTLNRFQYQNGKDVRIYDAYGIMKH